MAHKRAVDIVGYDHQVRAVVFDNVDQAPDRRLVHGDRRRIARIDEKQRPDGGVAQFLQFGRRILPRVIAVRRFAVGADLNNVKTVFVQLRDLDIGRKYGHHDGDPVSLDQQVVFHECVEDIAHGRCGAFYGEDVKFPRRRIAVEQLLHEIGVYSFSKYFGATGWRIGVVAIHRDNVFDRLLRQLPAKQLQELDGRYASLSQHPAQLRFIDRLVADSREVALNHTAGLSTPQQVQMTLFSAFALLDRENAYKNLTKTICRRRMALLYDGLGLTAPTLAGGAYYYTEFDLAEWANQHYGPAFADYLRQNYEPVDILFRLAEQSGIVLLNGGGFYGPAWSVRVSLANLDDGAYAQIGRELHRALESYVAAWRAQHPSFVN